VGYPSEECSGDFLRSNSTEPCVSDFSDDKVVDRILDTWEEQRPGGRNSKHDGAETNSLLDQKGVAHGDGTSLMQEIKVMFRRHSVLIMRDPVLYLGRTIAFLVFNSIFAFVYWNARPNVQERTVDKMWLTVWYCAVTTNMGVVAVYALNDEFKSILRETKNGMSRGLSYVLAKVVLVLPIMLLFSLFAIAIPAFAIAGVPGEAAKRFFFVYAAMMFAVESFAEAVAVLVEDPIIGMLIFMNYWCKWRVSSAKNGPLGCVVYSLRFLFPKVSAFLFGGFVIPKADMYYPWTIFYYVMPFSYYVRSAVYETTVYKTYESCEPGTYSAVCVQEETPGAGVPGAKIIEAFSQVAPIASPEDNTVRDMLILVAIGVGWKIVFAIGAIMKTRRVASISSTTPGLGNRKQQSAAASSKVPVDDYSYTLTTQRQRSSSPSAMPDDFDEEISV
jgi:ABC-2 type transporter